MNDLGNTAKQEERAMLRFRQMKTLQKISSVYARIRCTLFPRNSAANIGPNRFHQSRTVS